MEIAELAKPFGQWCPHVVKGKGCGIHGSHPASCQAFACQWLVNPGVPEAMRPDKVKVVLTTDEGARRLSAMCDPATPNAWRAEPVYGLLKHAARTGWGKGHAVVVRIGRRAFVVSPNEDLDLGDIDPHAALTIEQRPDGKSTVKVTPST